MRSGGFVRAFATPVVLIVVFVGVVFGESPRGIPYRAPGIDGVFVDLAARIPGFAGYYFDSEGDLVVQLTDPKQEELARSLLAEVASSRSYRAQWSRPVQIRVNTVRYDFAQLDEWRLRMSSMAFDGLLSLDTNERTNRIEVGIADEGARKAVFEHALELGVPLEAVVVEIEEPVRLAATLNDNIRPIVGGVGVTFPLNGQTRDCTLGWNVYYSNSAEGIPVGTKGFFTASHCGNRGSMDSIVFSQGGSRVGVERYDPPYFTNATESRCPVSGLCRWSDVVFVQYDSGISRKAGYVAQTTYRGFGLGQPGSLTFSTLHPDFSTSQVVTNPVMGDYLDKVGRTTGWTGGEVEDTCTDKWAGSSNYRMLCSDLVEATGATGDSGSPVFKQTSSTSAAVAGVLWAVDGFGFWFSPINEIEKDFGSNINYAW